MRPRRASCPESTNGTAGGDRPSAKATFKMMIKSSLHEVELLDLKRFKRVGVNALHPSGIRFAPEGE